MPENEQQPIYWKFDEYPQHDRKKSWYLWTMGISVALVIYALINANWLFALIIIMFDLILIINHRQPNTKIDISINHQGVTIGERHYEYKDFENFWIIYEPPEVKNLYLETKSVFNPRIIVPLEDQNPIHVKSFLRQYLEEDLDQEEEAFSDIVGRILKF